jgi:hypothetical protein
VQATLTDAAQAKTFFTGRTLFDALDRRCSGQLAAWLGALCQQPEVTDSHPWPGGLDIYDPNAVQVSASLPPVVLPHLWLALAQELSRWQQPGGDWNSCLRIGPTARGPEMALYLTSARRFGLPRTGALPPRALIDGTGDEELLALLFEMEITMLRAEVDPPPNKRHLAVRTGKRYGKTSLTSRNGQSLSRASAQVPLTPRANWTRMAHWSRSGEPA